MRFPKLFRLGLASVVAAAGLLSIASAQDTGASAPPDVAAGMEREVKLTPEEMLQEAEGIVARLDMATTGVQKQLELARQQRDVVKALCLDDKLSQLNVARKSAGERLDALRQAVARQDRELASHEYTIMVVFRERSDQLIAEAAACIGEEAGFIGETEVTVEIDPDLPDEDPTEFPVDPLVPLPPACVSCVL